MEEEKELKEKTLYLFSSNQTALYENDAINSVSLPVGSIMQLRYTTDNVGQTINKMITNKTLSKLAGQRLLVVFVNVKGRPDLSVIWEPEFYPLRFGKLVECRPLCLVN